MPDFELDDESVKRAKRLTDRLMGDLRMVSEEGVPPEMKRELFSDHRYADEAEGVPIWDVLLNVEYLATEFALARRWDGKLPCLKLPEGEIAPISLTMFFGWHFLSFPYPMALADWIELWERFFRYPPHYWLRELIQKAISREEQFEVTDLGRAEEGVGRGLFNFLSYRFAGIKKWAEWIRGFGTPTVSMGGGLQVQVSCRTPGLRIHVSPAYFFNWVFFGSPTTPVTGYVLPGRYIFAGDGPMIPKFTIDEGVFCIPPTYHATLMRF